MGPKTTELVRLLRDVVPLLRRQGLDHWAGWMAEAAGLLEKEDFRGITRVLGAYGGMGSFNDLWIDEASERLRSRIYSLANEIRRETDISERDR